MPMNALLRGRTQALAASLGSHRILLYSLASTVAVFIAIANALVNYSNFYSIAIFLSRSNRSVLVLANFAFVVALLCGRVVQLIFFGALRPLEIERLYDRLWFFVTESLLAFTIFRDDFDIPFGIMFGFLLFVKCFHWLASDRIEWMEQRQYPGPPPLFHFRMTTLFLILWTTDFVMFAIAVESTLTTGVGGMVLFACEYAILMASVANTLAKYLLTAYELRRAGRRGGENAPPWENKSMWTFYIELVTDFLKLSTYLLFFVVIIAFHGLPLNMIRDVYMTARSFITRLAALRRYQTATRNMDERYPNPTEEELAAMSDRTCIICREEIVLRTPNDQDERPDDGPNTTPKKLPCGHIFHFHCLRSWLERQQSCPTCRRSVLETNSTNQRPAPPPRRAAPDAAAQPNQPAPAQPPAGQGRPVAQAVRQQHLGFIGRLFGGAAQPPLVPGQFAQGPVVLPNPAGVNDDGQNVVIQYNIHYGQGQQPQGQNQPLVPPVEQLVPPLGQPLQPPPRLGGFYDGDGNFQPWEMDERWFTGTNEPSASNTVATPTSTEPETTTSGNNEADNSSASSATSTSDSDNSDALTARAASARAALRRFAMSRTPVGQHPPQTEAPTTETSGTESSSATTLRQTTPITPNGLSIPRLIPLYDHNQRSRLPRVLATPRDSSTPSRPLPGILTEEELRRLDQLTKESIDERLRILENVSRTINGCIDDLLRVRSVLPPSISPAQTTDQSTAENADAQSASAPAEPAPPTT